MAGSVVEDAGGEGVEIELQLPFAVQLPEIAAGVARRRHDPFHVVILDQQRVVVGDRRHRGGLRADDPVTEAHGVGEDAHVGGRHPPRRREIPRRHHWHARGPLAGIDGDSDTVPLEDGDERLDEERIVAPGVGVEEEENARTTAARWPGQPPACRPAHRPVTGKPGELPPLRNADGLLEDPACPRVGEGGIGQRGHQPPPPRQAVDAGEQPRRETEAVLGDESPLELHHERRHVDAGGTLDTALVAVEAGVGDRPDLLAGERLRVEPAGEERAEQIRLRPR